MRRKIVVIYDFTDETKHVNMNFARADIDMDHGNVFLFDELDKVIAFFDLAAVKMFYITEVGS